MYLIPFNLRNPSIASHNDQISPVIQARQATTTIISTAPPPADCAGQYSGGALAGAILGTFFGTLLLVYLFSVIKGNVLTRGVSTEEVVVTEKRRRHRSKSGT